MIRLGFTFNREIIHFTIDNLKVTYYDRKWVNGVQFLPKDIEFVKKILFSRNKIPLANQIIDWINEANSGENLAEYQSCKTDEELVEIVRRDALKKGLLEIKT